MSNSFCVFSVAMDCFFCNYVSTRIVGIQKYSLCGSCYEGARSIMAMMNKLDHDVGANKSARNRINCLPNSSKGLANVLKWVKEMKETEEELSDRLSYLAASVSAFKEQIHTDIQVKPGIDGPSVPAHRALLAARSTIFRNMLESGGCMAPAPNIVRLPELNYEELEAFLEFLYSGNLPKEKIGKHAYTLLATADKYEVPFLQKFCEKHILQTLNSSNALNVLEISDTCSCASLKEATLRFIVQNKKEILFSGEFDAFVLKNPRLSVEITRASCMESKT